MTTGRINQVSVHKRRVQVTPQPLKKAALPGDTRSTLKRRDLFRESFTFRKLSVNSVHIDFESIVTEVTWELLTISNIRRYTDSDRDCDCISEFE